MFDSPMEYCAVCGGMVTLDQSLTECRNGNGCASGQVCPLRKYFSGADAEPATRQETPPRSVMFEGCRKSLQPASA